MSRLLNVNVTHRAGLYQAEDGSRPGLRTVLECRCCASSGQTAEQHSMPVLFKCSRSHPWCMEFGTAVLLSLKVFVISEWPHVFSVSTDCNVSPQTSEE